MKLTLSIVALTCMAWSAFAQNERENWIKINWVKEIEGDFSFKDEWSYQIGVYLNKFGQLSCDGLCPPETYEMKDEEGRILDDSLTSFYRIIDTTHLFHSIQSEAWTYEWSGTDFIHFNSEEDQTILGWTEGTPGTHSGLNIKISGDSATSWIHYNSIMEYGEHTFQMENGSIDMDQQLFKKGIIKAKFNMTFINTLDPDKPLFWRGLIYTTIE